MKNDIWKRSGVGLYCYQPTGIYFARVRFGGKLYRRALGTSDYKLARRKLADFRNGLERTDASKGKTSFGAVLDAYEGALTGAGSTLEKKRAVIAKLRATWFGLDTLPLRTVKFSDVKRWLSEHYAEKSASYYNAALTVIRSALEMAVKDKIISENPAKDLTYHKRKKPVRLTPTFEQFKAIVASIRAQRFNREAEQSGDFVEFLGLAGLGQAEAAAITRAHVDLEAGQITVHRCKTDTGFVIPIYPQMRPLVEKLCQKKAHSERLFSINEARKALENACKRLGFPPFTHRSLRRMFITRAIEKGIDVKVISEWQGHRDGGKLILQTYSHVRAAHSQRMAQLMSDSEPENVVFLPQLESVQAGSEHALVTALLKV
jgi:integrase